MGLIKELPNGFLAWHTKVIGVHTEEPFITEKMDDELVRAELATVLEVEHRDGEPYGNERVFFVHPLLFPVLQAWNRGRPQRVEWLTTFEIARVVELSKRDPAFLSVASTTVQVGGPAALRVLLKSMKRSRSRKST